MAKEQFYSAKEYLDINTLIVHFSSQKCNLEWDQKLD